MKRGAFALLCREFLLLILFSFGLTRQLDHRLRRVSCRNTGNWPMCAPRHACNSGTPEPGCSRRDRKSTRLNCSHHSISYAVFCLKKKKSTHTKYLMHEEPRKREKIDR